MSETNGENMFGGFGSIEEAAGIEPNQGTMVNNPDSYNVAFERPVFSKLISALKLIENTCTDCEIKGGKLRTKTNNRQSVIAMDFTTVLQNRSLSLGLMKDKLNLLKSFELDISSVGGSGDTNSVIIEANESNFEFTDLYSKLIFRKPISSYLDNPYISDDDFATMISGTTNENLIFEYTMSSYIAKRIKTVCEGFKVDCVKFTMNGNTAKFMVETKSKDNSSSTATDIPLNRIIEGKYFMLTNLVFTLDMASDIVISCYSTRGDMCICKTTANYFGIPIVIYNTVKFTASVS